MGKGRTEKGGVPKGRNMHNPVQGARSDTQLGAEKCARENPRGEGAVKKERVVFRAERKAEHRLVDNRRKQVKRKHC